MSSWNWECWENSTAAKDENTWGFSLWKPIHYKSGIDGQHHHQNDHSKKIEFSLDFSTANAAPYTIVELHSAIAGEQYQKGKIINSLI